MITHISFDLDGTLSNEKFDKVLWNEELPKLVSLTHNIPFFEAQKHVFAEFYKALFIEKIENFTNVAYWFRRHKLKDWKTLIKRMRPHFFVYQDVLETLEYLSQHYTLVILSSSDRDMLDVKLDSQDFTRYFTHIFSTPSDFSISMKNREAFVKMLEKLNIGKDQLIHIGDNSHMDFDVPTSLGIKAYLVNRDSKKLKSHELSTLIKLKEIL